MVNQGKQNLPDRLVSPLLAAYEEYKGARRNADTRERVRFASRFANLVIAAREAGWSARTISDVCGLSTRRLHTITVQYGTGPARSPEFPDGPYRRRHLSRDEALQLRQMAPAVKSARGDRSKDAELRERSRRFTQLLIKHRAAGVSWVELAAATADWSVWPAPDPAALSGGITVNGLQARVARSEGTSSVPI